MVLTLAQEKDQGKVAREKDLGKVMTVNTKILIDNNFFLGMKQWIFIFWSITYNYLYSKHNNYARPYER